MKKLFILILILFPLLVHGENLKLSELTAVTSAGVESEDLLLVTINPTDPVAESDGGTRASRKLTLGNLLLWMAAQTVSVGGTWTMTTPVLDTPLITLADDSTLTLPTAAPTEDNSVMLFATDGTSTFVNLDDYAAAGDLASYIPNSTIVTEDGATDGIGVMVGTAANTPGFMLKGANNTFFGVNNAGVLGFHASFNPVLVAAPSSDDTYSGTVASFVAGEALAQWDVVYCDVGTTHCTAENVPYDCCTGSGTGTCGSHYCYKYDANGTYKAKPPRAMAVAAINSETSGTFLLTGIVRNDGWSQTTNQDEGKIVYADGTTAGAITLTKSTTSADMIAIVGYVIEQNVVYFNPSPILVEVP